VGLAEDELKAAMETEDLSAKLLGLIHTMATSALAVPPEEREAWFKRNWQNCFDEAISNKFSVVKAAAWADQIDSCVRSLIRVIQNSGGAPGGTA
jgi:hypothetical protein